MVYRTDTNARGFWLVKRTLGWKKLHTRELSRNQPILCFDVILQHDWPIKQCLPLIRVFFGGKTKRPCFDLFIHYLLKQITNTYRNHFSRSYGNRSISSCTIRSVLPHSLNLAFPFFSYFAQETTILQLQAPQLEFLLGDLSRKLQYSLSASASSRRSFLKVSISILSTRDLW